MRFALLPALTAPGRRVATHVEQAAVRLAIAVFAVAAMTLILDLPLRQAIVDCPSLAVVIAYVPIAAVFLAWSRALARRRDEGLDSSLRLRLYIGLVADVFVVGSFTALAGHYAPLALPLFIVIIVGYGWRFGGGWALAASLLGLFAFTVAKPLNPLFVAGSIATLGYYLCFLATPIYLMQVLLAPPARPPLRSVLAAAPGMATMAAAPGNAMADAPLLDDAMLRELREACPDPAQWRRLVRGFEEEARALLAEAGTAQDARDAQRRDQALHRLRGAAAAIAAMRLERTIGEIEAAPGTPGRWRQAGEVFEATLSALGGRG